METKETQNQIDDTKQGGNMPENIADIEAIQKKESIPKSKPESLLHTYKGDIQKLVKQNKVSLTHMIAQEANKKGNSGFDNGAEVKNNQTSKTLVLILAFVMLGVLALGSAYYVYVLREQISAPIIPKHTSLIFKEKMETIDATDKPSRIFKHELTRMRDVEYYSFGSVTELFITKQTGSAETDNLTIVPLSATELLKSLDATLDDRFLNLLHNEFMLGFYSGGENIPFLILQTDLYDYVFAGMLEWESKIEQDLDPLFSPAGKDSELTIFSLDISFADTVMNNLDVRVLRDSEGEIRLLYSFVNRNTLVITTDINAFIEIAERLRIAQ